MPPILSADEIELVKLVHDIKQHSGHGEIVIVIRNGKIEMLKQTKTVKL